MTALALASLLAVVATGARAAIVSPGLDFGTRFDRNRDAQGLVQDTLFALFSPRLDVRAESGTSRLELFGRTLFGYTPSPPLQPSGARELSYDRVSDRAEGSLAHALSYTDSVTVSGRYLRSHDPLELGDWSSLASNDVKQWGGEGHANLWRAEGSYQIDDWTYAAGFQPARMISWSAFALPVHGPADALMVGWRQHSLQVGPRPTVRADLALVGWRHLLAPWALVQLEGGGGRIRWSDGTVDRKPVFGFTLRQGENEPRALQPELHVWQDFATNMTAQLGRAVGTGYVALRWESVADFEGGIFRSPTYVRRGVVAVRDTLGGATVVQFEGSYGWTRPFHFSGPQVDLGRFAGSIERRLRPWLSVTGASAYLTQTAATNVPALRRVRVELSLEAHAP